jgi:DNA primase
MIDLGAIRRANPLPDVAGKLVALKARGAEWMGRCPFHSDRSPSFTVYAQGRRFHCFGCGASGDVLDFVSRAYGVPLPEAARMLGEGHVPKLAFRGRTMGAGSLPPASRTQPAALAIWARAVPAAGTLAEAYLRFRGLVPPYPPALRFLALPCGDSRPLPCLVAAVQEVAGEVTGIQRIWLAHDGRGKADVAKPKLSLGTIKGGAIRLGEPGASGCLIVCEGPEDGLSLAGMLGLPVWVAAGASFLPSLHFPPNVREVVIGADNDPAGRAAAEAAARAYAARGLTVRIIRPLDGFKDFNDELRGAC